MAAYQAFDVTKKVLIREPPGLSAFIWRSGCWKWAPSYWDLTIMNDYYDVSLKESRLGVLRAFSNFSFMKGDLADEQAVTTAFKSFQPDIVVNLAAQAGVRYSLDNPRAYIDSNIVGFFNILEACRQYPVQHLLFASSSSVYGNQEKKALFDDGQRRPSHQLICGDEEIERTHGVYVQPFIRHPGDRAAVLYRIRPVWPARYGLL